MERKCDVTKIQNREIIGFDGIFRKKRGEAPMPKTSILVQIGGKI